jgi:hypothetical protein
MAKFHLNSKPSDRFVLHLEDEQFEVEVAKLSITNLLALEREGREILKLISEDGQSLGPQAHMRLVSALASVIVQAHDLVDEAGTPINWHTLTDEQRREILAFVRVEDLFELFQRVGEVGRLKAHEKKDLQLT